MATLSSLTDRSSVLKAIAEFDQIGRRAFLEKYGFGKADRYFVQIGDRYYDSKAIAGAALHYQFPNEEVAKFSGGIGHAVDVFKRLRFIVADGAPKWLALTENVVNANAKFNWQDVTGERYHFPNQYRNLIRPGTQFVYYRGSLREGGKRVTPEYFGCGVIGDVYLDEATADLPATNQAWFADIVDFKPFANSIPFKDPNEVYLELGTQDLPRSNYWRTAVREIERDRYEHICQMSGTTQAMASVVTASASAPMPVVVDGGLMVERKPRIANDQSSASARNSARRCSGRAKIIGDLAEGIVCDWLRSQVQTTSEKEGIVWVASRGETPGYDIEDRRNSRAVIGYEVKATTGRRFLSVELTENEYRAAKEMRAHYYLVLVADAESGSPSIQMIQDPATMIDEGKLVPTPILFRLEKFSSQ